MASSGPVKTVLHRGVDWYKFRQLKWTHPINSSCNSCISATRRGSYSSSTAREYTRRMGTGDASMFNNIERVSRATEGFYDIVATEAKMYLR